MILRQYKVVFIGSSGVGKTSIINAIQGKPFIPNSPLTIAGGCVSVVGLHQGSEARLLIWDTAGQEKYRTIVPVYFKSAAVVVLVYDVTDPGSFESLEEWAALSRESAPADARLCVIGNKIDLADDRCLSPADGEAHAAELGVAFFRETSAQTGEGIQDLLAALTAAAMENTIASDLDEKETVVPDLRPAEVAGGSPCC
jgi:small GTP-binding protein